MMTSRKMTRANKLGAHFPKVHIHAAMVQAAPSQPYSTNKDNTPYLTTNQGTRVYNNDHSLTVGTRGETLK